MFQSKMSRVAVFCLAMAFWTAWPTEASAQHKGAPIGQWYGKFSDGGSITFVLDAHGNAVYAVGGAVPTVGTVSWRQASPVGGIITLRYFNGPRESFAYYSVTWIDANTIVFSDPYFRLTMRRK